MFGFDKNYRQQITKTTKKLSRLVFWKNFVRVSSHSHKQWWKQLIYFILKAHPQTSLFCDWSLTQDQQRAYTGKIEVEYGTLWHHGTVYKRSSPNERRSLRDVNTEGLHFYSLEWSNSDDLLSQILNSGENTSITSLKSKINNLGYDLNLICTLSLSLFLLAKHAVCDIYVTERRNCDG